MPALGAGVIIPGGGDSVLATSVSKDIGPLADNVKIIFGDASDAFIRWDGTNLIIDPGDVGILRVQGSARNTDMGAYSLASSVTTALTFSSGGAAEHMRINGTGAVFIGDSGNANMTQGLTINQGASDNEILAFKSSDVAHGLTGVAETDTFLAVQKASPTLGGTRLTSIGHDDALTASLELFGYGGTASTSKTTAGARGLIDLYASEISAGAVADITADGGVFSVRARVGGANVARFLIDEDGDMYSVTAGTTFDDFDDLALLEAYDQVRSGGLKKAVKAEFGKLMRVNEQNLIELGVLGGPIDEGGMTNQSQLLRVITGGMRDVRKRLMMLEQKTAALPEGV